jgi:GT2 family glycosyltransferase
MYPLVSVIILNWNGWKDTLECLESLYQIKYPNYKVILVDNHSQDQSLKKIRQYCQGQIPVETKFFKYQKHNKPIKIREITNQEADFKETEANSLDSTNPALTLIKNDANYGFALGNNIAMEYTLNKDNPDYILLLNNDTIVTPEFLSEMVKAGESDEKTGMVGCKLLNAFNPTVIDSTGHVISWGRIVDRGHGEVDKGQYDEQLEVMGVMAAAALYNKEMLQETGLLDTSYVTLGEDADLSWRAHNQGWKAIYTPNAIIYHKRGQAITKKDVIPEMTVLSLKNTAEYVSRYGNVKNKLAFLLLITKEALYVLAGSIIGRNSVSIRKYSSTLVKSYSKIIKNI